MLILPIKKKWYDMILSGEKKEEYRKLSPYYEARFKNLWQGSLIGFNAKRKILFRNGYSRKSPSFIATVTLDIGTGKTEWGAEEGKNYYILKICDIEPQESEDKKMRYIDHIRNMSDDQLAYFLNAIQPEITLWSLSMMRALAKS